MKFSHGLLGAITSTFVWAALACSPPNHPSKPRNLDRVCNESTQRRLECKASYTAEQLDESCRQSSFLIPYAREDYVADVRSCVAHADCNAVLGKECFRPKTKPSALAEQYCGELGTRDLYCSGHAASKESCLVVAAVLTDEVIASMRECLSRPCTSVAECTSDVMHLPEGFE